MNKRLLFFFLVFFVLGADAQVAKNRAPFYTIDENWVSDKLWLSIGGEHTTSLKLKLGDIIRVEPFKGLKPDTANGRADGPPQDFKFTILMRHIAPGGKFTPSERGFILSVLATNLAGHLQTVAGDEQEMIRFWNYVMDHVSIGVKIPPYGPQPKNRLLMTVDYSDPNCPFRNKLFDKSDTCELIRSYGKESEIFEYLGNTDKKYIPTNPNFYDYNNYDAAGVSFSYCTYSADINAARFGRDRSVKESSPMSVNDWLYSGINRIDAAAFKKYRLFIKLKTNACVAKFRVNTAEDQDIDQQSPAVNFKTQHVAERKTVLNKIDLLLISQQLVKKIVLVPINSHDDMLHRIKFKFRD